MCGNPFKSHTPDPVVIEKPVEKKVEKVPDPTPTVVTPTDTGSANDRMAEESQKQRRKKGYAATRVAEDRSVLTDAASAGKRNTLG